MAVTGDSPALHSDWTRERVSLPRKIRNQTLWILCGLALVLLVVPVVWVIGGVTAHAVSGWKWSVLTTPTTATGGGLSNAIVGTLVLMLGVLVLAGVIGIACGVFISEMAPPRLGAVLRSASELLSGVPSIVFGYVGYVALVVGLHWDYSLLAALIVLSLLVVPYVAKSTELALSQVPLGYREGAEALGMSQPQLLRRVVMRAAIPGMATGIIVALAISIGETAPLLYTAGFSNGYPSLHLTHAGVPYLTYVSYEYFDEPYNTAVQLSHDASFLLVVLVLMLIVAARLVVRATQKYAPDRAGGRGIAGGRPRRPG
jgi:phosphate transport system permease protein